MQCYALIPYRTKRGFHTTRCVDSIHAKMRDDMQPSVDEIHTVGVMICNAAH